MANNNYLSPDGPATSTNDGAAVAANEKQGSNAVKGLALGAAGAAAIAGAGGLAYAATKGLETAIENDENATASEASEAADNGVATSAGSKSTVNVNMRAEHHYQYRSDVSYQQTSQHNQGTPRQEAFDANQPSDVEVPTPAESAESQQAHTPTPAQVDPNLLTDDLQDDILLIDDGDMDTPGYFFDPEEMVVTNINGKYVTRVESTLPDGERVYLVDSDNDGSFDQIYDLDGNILSDDDDVQMMSTDDVKAIMMDRGETITDINGNEISHVSMADVDETLDGPALQLNDDNTGDVPSYNNAPEAPVEQYDNTPVQIDSYPEPAASFDSGESFSASDTFDTPSVNYDSGADDGGSYTSGGSDVIELSDGDY